MVKVVLMDKNHRMHALLSLLSLLAAEAGCGDKWQAFHSDAESSKIKVPQSSITIKTPPPGHLSRQE